MPELTNVVLSLVERGWQAARECSLDAEGKEVQVLHLVKGSVDPDVLALIAPKPHIRLVSVPRTLFWPLAWLTYIRWVMTGRLHAVLVDHERSLRRVRAWVGGTSVRVLMVRQGHDGYEVWRGDQRLPRAAWYEVMGSSCASR